MRIASKACSKCNETKLVSHFYENKKRDGLLSSQCKNCIRAAVKARRDQLLLDPIWVERELERQRIKQRGKSVKIPPDQKRQHVRRHNEKNPQKQAVRNSVARAIRAGRLIKSDCEKCGNSETEAHHEDYSKPLDVNWLCSKHHAERHVEIRRIQRMMRSNAAKTE